ncbi:MAG: heme A synthase [Geminocystis sp.]|nr:heme A synthase [Geminocystis sp.]HIK37461.1 heme A synthase [Geminocystis sp. M7585_C2015_104]MCS7147043.1 heme A synthase [Geminocystis sp.]MCX8079309.1 heme A synthase [Geminocystis sp.]MDW8115866.1 heme A synthase [Geminocystis sp.]
MTDIVYPTSPKGENISLKRIRWWLERLVIATWLLLGVGAATRVMNAGLACPDWPLCYGKLLPTVMNLQIFLEWFHRLDAALVGVSTIGLVIASWWHRPILPPWLPWAVIFALFLVVFQVILGGLTVIELLRFDIVQAHLAVAFLFFGTLVGISCMLAEYRGNGTVGRLPLISVIATVLVYIQCLLGGLVASRWALHQCFYGRQLCGVMNSHIVGIFPATIATVILVVWASKTPALTPKLRHLSLYIVLTLVLQILLGLATFHFRLQVQPLTVAHHVTGAALFGLLIAFTVFSYRDKFSVIIN